MDFNAIRGVADLNGVDTYAADMSVGDTSYVHGGLYILRINGTNTVVDPTVDINSIGAIPLKRKDFSDLRIGELKTDSWVVAIYDSGEDALALVDNGLPYQGVDTTGLTAGGGTTITLIPGTHNPIQLITGSATLSTNYVFTFGGSPKDGDRFFFDYRATMTLGVQTITIAGLSLTATQALGGAIWIEAYYDGDAATWRAKMLLGSTVTGIQQTFPNKAARVAAVPDFNGQAGVQLDINAMFQASGTSAGNWDDAIPIGNVIYTNSVSGHTLAQGATGAKSNPFNTLAEAKTAALALLPTASNIVIVDAVGSFNEILDLSTGAAGVVGLHYNLNNSIVDYTTNSATYTITDGGFACESIIYGNAKILRSAGASALGTVLISHASSDIQILCNKVDATIGAGIRCTAGTLYVKAPKGINGVTGISHDDGVFTIDASITATTTGVTSAFQQNCVINGNITVSNGQGIISTGANNGTIFVKGNITTTNSNGINLSNAGAGVNIVGSITSSGGTAASIVLTNISNVTVRDGSITNTGSDHAININNSIVNLYDCNISSSATRAFSGASTYGVLAKNCKFTSAGDDAIFVGLPSVSLHGKFENCYIKTTNTNSNAVLVDGGSGEQRPIFKDCVFIAHGTGKSILATGAETVKIYGTCMANADVEAADVTLTGGGTFVVDITAVYGVSVGTVIL